MGDGIVLLLVRSTLVIYELLKTSSESPRGPQADIGAIDDLQHTDFMTMREGPALWSNGVSV
jgi:hypothetical protein